MFYCYTFYWEENYGYDTDMMDIVFFAKSEKEAHQMAMKYAEEHECTDYLRKKYPNKVGQMRHHHTNYYD